MAGSIRKNYIYNVAYQILVLLTPLIVTPYISRVMGAAGVGEYSYTASIVSYFVLFATLGTTTYGQREISYHQKDREGRSIVFWELWLLIVGINMLTMVGYGIFCWVQHFSPIYLVQVFSILSVSADIVWLFQGMEDFKSVVVRNVILKLVGIVFIFCFVKDAEDVVLYAFGMSIMNFVANLMLWPMQCRYVDKPQVSALRPLRHLIPTLKLFVPTIAISIYTVLDKTMIGALTSSYAENGYYEQGMKIPKMLLVLVTALGTVMVPRIGYYFEQREYEAVRDYMYRGYRFVWLLGIPLSIGLFSITERFVPFFFGDGFEPVIPILKSASWLILIIGISNVTGTQYLIPTKRESLFTKTVLLGASVNLLLNILLIPSKGALGATGASVIAEIVITMVQLISVRRELSVKRIIVMSKNYLIAGMVMFGVLWGENRILETSISGIAVMVISGAALYFVCLIVLRDEFFLGQVKQVLKKVKLGKN